MEYIDKNSDILKDNPEVHSMFYTYKYKIYFKIPKFFINFKFIIDGQERYSDLPVIEFYSQYQLTEKEVLDKFKGTTGIKKITGEFKKD